MSRKDSVAIAAIVARHVYDLNDAGIALVSELADYMEADNVNFDRDRFAMACVPNPSELATYMIDRPKPGKTFASIPHSTSDTSKLPRTPSVRCSQCNRAMSPAEAMLGSVCGVCCRHNQREVTR